MRSKSPRTSGPSMKSSPSPTTRSKSVPNTISQTPNKTSKSPSLIRTSKAESSSHSNFTSNSKIESIFDFFINEISSKQFFPTQRKKELLDLARASKQNGNRYALSHKKSQIVSTQFWTTWNSFQNKLEQELNKQLTQNQNSVSRNLSILSESVNSIKTTKKLGDLQDKVSELVSKGSNLPDNIEDISPIINDFKLFQSDVVRNEFISKQQTLKYKFTSTISQILTLLRSIKDMMISQTKFETQFENSYSILEEEIPQVVKGGNETNQASSRKTTPTPTKTNIKSKFRPSPSPPSKSISPSKSSPSATKSKSDISSDDFENEFNYDNTKRQTSIETGNKKERGQVSYSTDLKNSKNAAIESKKGFSQPMNEISKLQNQIARLAASKSISSKSNENFNDNSSDTSKRSDTLSYSIFKNNRKPVQFDLQFDSISDLHDQKRELTYENYKLNAICESYLKNISDSNSTMGLYNQNLELMKQRFKLNEQLFTMRVDNLHMNQISQRATLRPSLLLPSAPDNISFSTDDVKQLKKDYSATLKLNKDEQSRYAAMKEKYEELEKNYVLLMKQKCNSTESNDKNNESILDNLRKIKIEYRTEITKMLIDQTKAQNDSVKKLKNKTNKAILRMKTKAENDISAIESQKGSNEQVNQIRKKLQQNLQKITKNEINELTEINQSLLKWISQIKTQNIDLNTNMQSLVLQYEMMQRKVNDTDFDINSAFNDEIERIREKNKSLKELLRSSHQKLAQIDISLGGSKENVPIEQRLQSIISKIEI